MAVGVALGAVAVAENGAVALAGSLPARRALLFLCEHLIVLVDATNIASQMHIATEAVADLIVSEHHFTWVAGPSKTGDIPGTIVVGAHGPRALAVVGFRA